MYMKIKNKFLVIFFLFSTSLLFSQRQLKYSFSIEKNRIDTIVKIINKNFGDVNFKKYGKLFWVKNSQDYEYKITLRKNKVRLFYKGTDAAIENKIQSLYKEIEE